MVNSLIPDLHDARILLVDDTTANLEILRELLEAESYNISMAPDGATALKIASRARPDLILLDVMMPEMDGYQVCRLLKEDAATREIPVIFITAQDQTDALVAGFQAGGVDYIPKPFRDDEVLARVRNALITKFLFDQNRSYQAKIEKELQTAHHLQMGLMPRQQPRFEGYTLTGRCIPAEQVGGDLYQYFDLHDGNLALSIADVTGHAMEAAIPVVLFSGMLQTEMEQGTTLEEIFTRLNRLVHRILDSRTFVCFLMAQLDPDRQLLRLSNGGCPYPLHYRRARGDVVELDADASYPLGIRLESRYPVHEIKLQRGDRIVFCSDGIGETENSAGDLFGFEQVAKIVGDGCRRNLSAEELLELIMTETRSFAGGEPQTDDQTVLVLAVEE